MPTRRRSRSRSGTRRHQRDDDEEMRGGQRRHGETGGGGGEGHPRRLRSEIGEVSGSLWRITRGELLVAEVFARSPPPSPLPPTPFSSQVTKIIPGTDGVLFGGGGGQGGEASSSSLFKPAPAAPLPTVRTSSSSAVAADGLKLKPPPEAAATATSSKKRNSGPESSSTASSKRPKTVHRQQNKSPLPPPPPKRAARARFAAIPLPPPPSNEEVLATQKRVDEMGKKYAGLIAKSQDRCRGRDAERAKAREALREMEREARRAGLFAMEAIRREHLRALDITRDIEYAVSPECHRGEDGVLRVIAPSRHSPVSSMLGLLLRPQDGGELELDEE
ncbi:hypothetical protein OsJ_06205 [Oryza sativa Japonica Group]|uniref:Uncharacterized protein n=1 Tax=Oryza sativa subsp. japonica TaxID=39947 RepID=A3A5E9_ORYSJ|nr:hypothetical protein OsJ_06205 [Oryza sativa Japonica Group]